MRVQGSGRPSRPPGPPEERGTFMDMDDVSSSHWLIADTEKKQIKEEEVENLLIYTLKCLVKSVVLLSSCQLLKERSVLGSIYLKRGETKSNIQIITTRFKVNLLIAAEGRITAPEHRRSSVRTFKTKR